MGDDDSKLGGKKGLGSKIGGGDGKKSKSLDQEDRVADKGDGKRVAGSGAFADRSDSMFKGPAGDVELEDFKVECKRTDHKSYRLDEETLKGAKRDARRADKHMAVAVDIDGIESSLVPSRVVVIEEEVFYELLDAADTDEG